MVKSIIKRLFTRKNKDSPIVSSDDAVTVALDEAGNEWLTREEQVTDEWSRYGEIR